LLNEQYKGEIVMSNPAISGTNYGVVNAILQTRGEEGGWEYFEKLNENIAFYGRRGSDPKNKVTADEYAIGITYLDGTIDALLEQYDVTIVYPTDGIPYIPEGVAVFKNAENVDAAAYFVEWLYSNDENLQLLAKIDQKTAVKVIKPSMEGVELAYSTDILVDVDVALFGSQRADILAKFEVLMGDKAVTE
jgi:iron(III) transport system substrate-binding protein